MEFEEIEIIRRSCDENGDVVEISDLVSVIKGDTDSTANLYLQVFEALADIQAELCGIQDSIDNQDLNVGIPMRSWEGDTGECAVLYFNSSDFESPTVGRYVNVPHPHHDRILTWAETQPVWYTGSWYAYSQYLSSRGPKVANYAPDSGLAASQLALLKSLVREDLGEPFHRGQPRQVPDKLEIRLNLKRVTYFPFGLEKAGRQQGVVWYVNENLR